MGSSNSIDSSNSNSTNSTDSNPTNSNSINSNSTDNSTNNLTSSGYKQFNQINGSLHTYSAIVKLNEEELIKAKNEHESSAWKETIKQKILEEQKNNPKILDDIKLMYGLELDDFIIALGDEKVFKETFLLPNYVPNKIMKELNEELSNLQELKDLGDNMTTEELNNVVKRINERGKRLSESKLELILTECLASDNKNFLFRAFVNAIYDFGVLHSAISLDGTIIEWGRGPCGQNIVCPNLDIKRFLFAFEIKAKEDDKFYKIIWNKIKDAGFFILNLFTAGFYGKWSLGRINDKKLDKIAKVCVLFNKNKYYNSAMCNCQHFVKIILNAIESDFNNEGEFGNIIRKLEKDGKIDLVFKGKTFNTRKDLDDYVKLIDFSSLCKNDKKLLICYKNTFDLYLRNQPNNSKFQTTEEANECWKNLINKEMKNLK